MPLREFLEPRLRRRRATRRAGMLACHAARGGSVASCGLHAGGLRPPWRPGKPALRLLRPMNANSRNGIRGWPRLETGTTLPCRIPPPPVVVPHQAGESRARSSRIATRSGPGLPAAWEGPRR